MARAMDFIFMLTRADRTVADCLAVVESTAPLGLAHIGFKDVGVDRATMAELNRRIHAQGAQSWLECVNTAPGAAPAAARLAVELGVDCLLGGHDAAAVLPLLAGTGIRHFPFAGRTRGHPTVLEGDAAEVARDCRAALAAGCAGVDLLAWRARDAEPLALVRAARAALGNAGRLVVAGSVESTAQIGALGAAGADAFTVGTAIFAGRFDPDPSLAAQLRAVLAAVDQPAGGRRKR